MPGAYFLNFRGIDTVIHIIRIDRTFGCIDRDLFDRRWKSRAGIAIEKEPLISKSLRGAE